MSDSGKVDELKGRVKEAVGVLRDDDVQRKEGQDDQSAGKLKQAGEKLVDAVKDVKGAFKR